MRLTIDSQEPIDDVLRVVGSLYGVTLTSTDTVSDARTAASPAEQSRAGTRRRSKRANRPGTRVDARTVREWASGNGFEVSARGALSAAVRDAYQAAHTS